MMDLVPGDRLGCFILGMSVNDTVRLLRKNFVPVRPQVEVIFDEKEPLQRDVILDVVDFGLHLRFEPVSQRLRMIDVYDLGKLEMSYGDFTFGRATKKAASRSTFLGLYKTFGPTYPGFFDTELDMYLLRYNGVCFMFQLPPKYKSMYSGGGNSKELPLELPDGNGSPPLSRLMIFSGFEERNPKLKTELPRLDTLPISISPEIDLTSFRSSYLEEVCFKISTVGQHHNGSFTTPTSVQFLRRLRNLQLGSTVQDLISELGQPGRIYFKQDSRMNIHSLKDDMDGMMSEYLEEISQRASSSRYPPVSSMVQQNDTSSCFTPNDYFYNYFHLGLDFLIDSKTHVIKKIVAHTNFPGHTDFSQYNKCEFRLVFSSQCTPEETDGANSNVIDEHDCVIITPEMKWQDVEALLGPCGRPMIRDNGAVANPFGATYLYAYDGCIFEVMRNGYIAAITVF